MEHKKQSLKQQVIGFFRGLVQIGRIAYSSSPRLLVVILLLDIVTAIFPIVIALTYKAVFDQLGHVLGDPLYLESPVFSRSIIALIVLFGFLTVGQQALSHLTEHLSGTLTEKLNRYTTELFYRRLLEFQGLSYFESPDFH